jgi:hybrid cluster-associated redox disulfide protein
MTTKQQIDQKSNMPQVDSGAKVTKDSNLAEVIFKYPQAAEVLTDYGLHCVGCFASSFDSIKDASAIHNMSMEEIDEMVERVNEVIELGE